MRDNTHSQREGILASEERAADAAADAAAAAAAADVEDEDEDKEGEYETGDLHTCGDEDEDTSSSS